MVDWAFNSKNKESKKDPEVPSPQDVYPLSIYYEKSEKICIRIYRLLSFLLIIYILVPFDIYITYTPIRAYYFGTQIKDERIKFSDLLDNSFTFNLTNCKTLLMEDS